MIIAVLTENSLSYEELMETTLYSNNESIEVLLTISNLIQSRGQFKDTIREILDLLRQLIAYHSVRIYIVNDQSGRVEEVIAYGGKRESLRYLRNYTEGNLNSWVSKHRDPFLIHDIGKDSKDEFRSFASSPLVIGNNVLGAIILGHREPNFFHADHLKLLRIITGELALLVNLSRYENELIETKGKLSKLMSDVKIQKRKLSEMEKYRLFTQATAPINHTINNPLTTILGNIELIFLKYPSLEDDLVQKLYVIQEEAIRISDIIKKMGETKRVVLKD